MKEKLLTIRAHQSEIKEVQDLLKEIKKINRRAQIEILLMALRRLRKSYRGKYD